MFSRINPAERPFFNAVSRRLLVTALIPSAALLFSPAYTYCQSEIKIIGRTIDSLSGNPIPGATVIIEDISKTTIADGNGEFQFNDLPSGTYSLTGRRIGYNRAPSVDVDIGPYTSNPVVIYLTPAPVTVAGQVVTSERINPISVRHEGNRTIVNIEAGAFKSIDDLAKLVPELEVVEAGAQKFIRIRGADLNGTVIKLDGRVINSSLTSRGDISTIPLGSVRSVEIIKGGDCESQGLAGTLNFITAGDYGDPRSKVSAGRGSYGLENYSIHSGGYHPSGINLGFEAENIFYRGDFKFTDPRDSLQTRENNFSQDFKLFGSLGYSRSGLDLRVNGRYFQRDAGVPGPIFQLTPAAESRIEEREIYLTFVKQIGSEIAVDAVSGITFRRADYNSPRTATNFIGYKTRFDEQSRDISIQVQRAGQIDLDGHIYLRYESLDGDDLIRPESSFGFHSRLVNAIAAGFVYRHPDPGFLNKSSALTFGIRRDGGDRGEFWAPSSTLRLNFDLPGHPGFDISYSSSRRLPDMTDLYWKEDVFASPNAELKPEKSRGHEFGLNMNANGHFRFDLRIAQYNTIYEDLIVWRRWAGDKFKPVNLSEAEISGWEISVKANPFSGPLHLRWMGAFNRPLNKEMEESHHNKYLTYRPVGTQTAAVELEFHDLRLEITGRHIGTRYTTEENTKSLPPVDIVDLDLKYGLKVGLLEGTIEFAVLNAGDIQYEILERRPERPREYRINMEIFKKGGLF